MRAVVQRVSRARVSVGGSVKGEIGKGLLAYVGVEAGDGPDDVAYIAGKLMGLRVFEGADGRMSLDVMGVGAGGAKGALLLIPQFTLLGDCRRGRRPSFDRAERPEGAVALYRTLLKTLRGGGLKVEEGEFQAHMEVESINDGPITLLIDSRKLF